MCTVIANDSTHLANCLNDSTVSEIVLNPGVWNNGRFSSAVSSRTISTPVTIRGTLSQDGSPAVGICGLTDQLPFIRNNNLALYSFPKQMSNFPRLYVDGTEATLLQTAVIEVSNESEYALTRFNTREEILYTVPKTQLMNGTMGGNSVNLCSLLKVGSILCMSYQFLHLRFVVHDLSGDVVTLQCEEELKSGISIKDTKFQVYNCSGYPSVGMYDFGLSGNNITIRYNCGSSAGTHDFRLALSAPLLSLEEMSGITFCDICFRDNGVEDITLGSSKDHQSEDSVKGAIVLSGCSDIRFEGCVFTGLMGYAVDVKKAATAHNEEVDVPSNTGITIARCHVHDTHGGGFHFDDSDNCLVAGCLIEHFGKTMRSSCGILLQTGKKTYSWATPSTTATIPAFPWDGTGAGTIPPTEIPLRKAARCGATTYTTA